MFDLHGFNVTDVRIEQRPGGDEASYSGALTLDGKIVGAFYNAGRSTATVVSLERQAQKPWRRVLAGIGESFEPETVAVLCLLEQWEDAQYMKLFRPPGHVVVKVQRDPVIVSGKWSMFGSTHYYTATEKKADKDVAVLQGMGAVVTILR